MGHFIEVVEDEWATEHIGGWSPRPRMTETHTRSFRVAAVLVRRQVHGAKINVSPAKKSGTIGDW